MEPQSTTRIENLQQGQFGGGNKQRERSRTGQPTSPFFEFQQILKNNHRPPAEARHASLRDFNVRFPAAANQKAFPREPLCPDPRKENSDFVLIKSIETISEMSYKISEGRCKIGRHSTNNIVIFDESVSRFHAEIGRSTGGFALKDVGSTTGTFIKVDTPVELRPNMIFEIGSYQLIVKQIYLRPGEGEAPVGEDSVPSFVEFRIYESPDDVDVEQFRLENGSSIGRKSTNSVCFNEDLHMSNLHCKIQFIGECPARLTPSQQVFPGRHGLDQRVLGAHVQGTGAVAALCFGQRTRVQNRKLGHVPGDGAPNGGRCRAQRGAQHAIFGRKGRRRQEVLHLPGKRAELPDNALQTQLLLHEVLEEPEEVPHRPRDNH